MPSEQFSQPSPIVFVVTGEPLASAADIAPARERAAHPAASGKTRAVRIAGIGRGGGKVQRLEAHLGQDTVVLTVGNAQGHGPDLCLRLHPEHARDLLQAQANVPARGAADAGTVQVPASAHWQGMAGAEGSSRGLLSGAVFKTLELVGLDPKDALAKLAATALGEKLDGQVNEGVYALQQHQPGSLKLADRVTSLPSAEPTLVLIHGTFVDTDSTFGKFWNLHSGLVAKIFKHYADRVYALDHGTVMRSPIANALTLAATLPQGARLHLLTHSRGGLVAEALLRASEGISAADLALFEGQAYAAHRADLRQLGDLLHDKNIRVERIVRVACPAYGTLLASNRLDAYLSVLAWLLERIGVPLMPDLVRFVDAVARQRADPGLFPGLEAMRRGSVVLRWLNQDDKPTPSALRVVAGDMRGDSLASWVKALLADSFYWTDNDLVVQTNSMYGGMPRANEASFLLERSGKTDHFSYFRNEGTATGIARALTLERPGGFASIGPLSRQGQDAGGMRAMPELTSAAAAEAADDGSRPAVILVPGFMGSKLKVGEQPEWFVWSRLQGMFDRLAWNEEDKSVTQDGPIDSHYGDLIHHLGTSHHVVCCGHDWRAPLIDSAALLAERLTQALQLRRASGQPVRVLAHSTGGIVLRVMQLEHPQVWRDMMARPAARVLMLAPPNRGCWAPLAVSSGDDPFCLLLSSIGGAMHEVAARQQLVGFPGLLQWQAGLTDPALDLADADHWKGMGERDFAAALRAHPWHNADEQAAAWRWALPAQADLDSAAYLWRRLDAQLPSLQNDAANMAIVLGQAPSTPCSLYWDDGGMHFRGSAEGDGRVTWASARLPGVATWKSGHAHGELPRIKANFEAYTELLQTGHTARLSVAGNGGGGRISDGDGGGSGGGSGGGGGGAAGTLLPRLRDCAPQTGGAPVPADTLLSAAMGSIGMAVPDNTPLRTQGAALTIEVVHGDLKFIREPLLLGHLRALQLTGSEQVVDQLMGHALQDALDVGLYPVELGQHQIFVNRHADPDNPYAFPRPLAAVVAGLGDEGELAPNALADAVRQAVLAYQRQAGSPPDRAAGITLASTTLGSGGSLSVSQSVLALARGVGDANARLAAAPTRLDWPAVTHLHIVELFHSRAQDAWHTLHLAIGAGTLSAELRPQVRKANGARSLPMGGHYRAAGYDLVRIGEAPCGPHQSHDELEFSLHTSRARSEVRGKSTQRALVDAMVAAAEQDTRYNADLARSLFHLLVPQEIKTYLGAADTLLFEVDSKTARYPWEMLDDSDGQHFRTREPFALRLSGALLRKMRVDQFRRQPADAPTDAVLVIGAPKLDALPALPDLPGARAEASAVAELFGTVALLDQDFLDIIIPALSRPWKIIHMAGHGQYDEHGDRSGMLMSGGLRFGPTEFESMATVPELVFVNCCHLGKTASGTPRQHALFAANVAEQLIRNGVRCVVAAGWAVDDEAARAFALGFYGALKSGDTFAGAVRNGRRKAYDCDPGSNTWAAYQCYGDPAWTLHRNINRDTPAAEASELPVLATVDELLVALETTGFDAQDASEAVREKLRRSLEQLQDVASVAWKASGRVAEAFGMAWRDVGDKAQALVWLELAIQAADGTASLAAREQQLNLRARQADTLAGIRATVVDIKALIALAPTAERWSILGSAYKRSVMKMDASGADASDDLGNMKDAYARAEALKPANLFYPLMQRCMAQLRLLWLAAGAAPTLDDVGVLRQSLAQQEARAPDFWCVVGQHEASMLEGLIEGRLAAHMAGIEQGLRDVHGRVSNQHYWSSVHDTAQFLLQAYMAKAPKGELEASKRYLALVKSFT